MVSLHNISFKISNYFFQSNCQTYKFNMFSYANVIILHEHCHVDVDLSTTKDRYYVDQEIMILYTSNILNSINIQRFTGLNENPTNYI